MEDSVKTICKIIYGSRLYGTNTENSDTDYNGVHMLDFDELVFGNNKTTLVSNTNKDRNTKDDVDKSSKELRAFIRDCLGGQSYTVELLNAPRNMIVESSPIWEELILKKDKLISNNIIPFIKYAKNQAKLYANKAEKYNCLIKIYELISSHSGDLRLKDIPMNGYVRPIKYMKWYNKKMADSYEMYFEAPNCSFPSTRKIDEVLPVLKSKIDEYGDRVVSAATTTEIELKSYYHAMRIIWMLEEYLDTRKVILPTPRAKELMDIRNNKFSKKEIEEMIAKESERVMGLPNNLPEPDYEYWNKWLKDVYRLECKHFLNGTSC